MSELVQTLALLCTVLGVASAAAVGLRTLDVRLAIAVLLDFLLAAGLLRLGDDPTPRALLTAAVTVGLRMLLTFGLRQGAPLRRADGHDEAHTAQASGPAAGGNSR